MSGQAPGEIDLSWNASTDNVGVTGYAVYRNNVKIADVTTMSYADRSVKQGVTYSYRVRAYDAAGHTSSASNSTSVVADWTAPNAPTGLRTTRVSQNRVDFTWNTPSDNVKVTGFLVFRNGVQIANITHNSYSDRSAPRGSTVAYTVKAYDAAGNTSASSSPLSVGVP